MYVVTGMTLAVAVSGCWSKGNAQVPGEHVSLPLRDSGEVCVPEHDLCSWATSTDAVVWGRIQEIRLSESPMVIDRTDTVVEECNAPISPAVELDVIVDQVFHGEVGKAITVRVGALQRESWVPRPAFGAYKTILDWSPNNLGDTRLEVGRPLGLALHFDESHKVWSLMGEPLFGLVRNGGEVDTVKFQDSPQCRPSPTKSLEGSTLEELASTLSSCEASQRGVKRREAVRRLWGATPQRFMAAVCLATAEAPRANAPDEIQVLQ